MLRAVIYARCSTEEESQRDALEKQVADAEECVTRNGWLLVDRYVESRSGTTTKGRKEYNRLYSDMLLDKFNLIVIKSQDRLMRNTKDWYLFVDRLTTQHKKLYMYIECKFYSADDALITGIKAILAEDYSRELSKKINHAHKTRQRHNGNIILTSNAYGFKKLPDKSVILVEAEAKVKERMYQLCAEGFGTRTIAAILKNEGIVGRNGKPFAANSILRILRNPMNKGTVVMNKKHFDFDTKKILSIPETEQFVYENKVPRTVSDELWETANRQIDSRVSVKSESGEAVYGKNSGKYPLSGKMICGLCGAPYYRRTRRKQKDKTMVYEWKCKNYLETGRNSGTGDRPQLRKVPLGDEKGCDNVHMEEKKITELLENMTRENDDMDKEKILKKIHALLNDVLEESDIQAEICALDAQKEKIESQRNTLVDKLLEGILENSWYLVKQRQLEKELQGIEGKIKELELRKQKESAVQERVEHIEKMMQDKKILERSMAAAKLDEIHKIIIYPTYLEIDGTLFECRGQKKDVLQEVLDYMRETPNITAREIAQKCGRTTSCIQQRIARLRKAGRVRFVGKAGRGYWEVLENQKNLEA